MIFKRLAIFGSILLALTQSKAEEEVTSTETKYVTNACLDGQVSSIMSNNPPSQTTGIPIVFVYANNDKPNTIINTSTFEYTVSEKSTVTETVTNCGFLSCQTTSIEHIVNTVYKTTACVTYTTTTSATATVTSYSYLESAGVVAIGANERSSSYSTSSSIKNTKYLYETDTESVIKEATITMTAPTTTTTVFSATTVPTTLFESCTSKETIATTKKNPLITQSPISSANSKTINTDQYSSPVTICITTTTDSAGDDNLLSSKAQTVSTIDLRLSEEPVYATTSKSTFGIYHNSTSDCVSSGYSSSYVLSSSSLTSSSAGTTSSSSVSSSSSSSSPAPVETSVVPEPQTCYSGDLFEVISTSSPPSVFARQELPLSIPAGINNDGVPIETNKFYANLFLGDQTDQIWSYPYGLFWTKADYYGFAIQHTNTSNRVFGSQNTNNVGVDSYYFNPIQVGEMILSSTSFSESNNYLGVSEMKSMSVSVAISASQGDPTNFIEIPIVQGMGFVTGIYHGDMVPLLNSLVGIETLTKESSSALPSTILKYRATLFTGGEWLVYVTLPSSSVDFELTAKDPYNLEGSQAIDGLIIQIASAPEESSLDGFYDEAAGQYVVSAVVQGSVACSTSATYEFAYTTEGRSNSGYPLVFAFPHHVESLDGSVAGASTGIQLSSTTKGQMTGYLTNKLTMTETLETNIQFLPWVQGLSGTLTYSADLLKLIAEVANSELQVDMAETVASMDSNYFSGKVIDKYAYILLVVSEILKDDEVTASTLSSLKQAFEPFLNNQQYYPLMYDTKFGGITSTASQGGDTGADFGSAYYNDHHFHYGYFVHAAAIVGYIDNKQGGTWVEDNKDWVNALIRDVANPSEEDNYFPVSRMFDWFAGHSWAAGLFASGDGKNEESTSEDYNFAYGMKLWGQIIGDQSMESRGDLMLAIMARSMNLYFLYKSDNTIQPAEILPNKVSGIFFDNKVDYTTYFGSPDQHPEYVHGVHMLPVTPASSLIRGASYVQEEWTDQVSTFIGNVNSGWTGILRLNQALFDSNSAYSFFSSDSWSSTYLDNGLSRTWSLAFSGGIAGST
ncbi:hypothetical protein G9P44_003631 [Scheffersomyces stipitis]|nr:hypothetical protein G9P44_003631 [Scheffersomyces stipitis]